MFKFVPIGFDELAIAIGLGFTIIPMVELVKFIQRKLEKKKGNK